VILATEEKEETLATLNTMTRQAIGGIFQRRDLT
jgi:hypothetical protein